MCSVYSKYQNEVSTGSQKESYKKCKELKENEIPTFLLSKTLSNIRPFRKMEAFSNKRDRKRLRTTLEIASLKHSTQNYFQFTILGHSLLEKQNNFENVSYRNIS